MHTLYTYINNITLMISLFCFIMGVLYLFFPRVLFKIVEMSNTVLIQDSIFFKHPVKTGIILSIYGILIITVGYLL